LILQLIFVVAISLTKNLIDLPLLRRMDNITAGVLGLVRGFLFLFIIFAFVPLLYVAAPAAFIEQFIRGSKFINFFLDANFFTSVIKGVI
ncbi:MAG TPA: hypothetical protein VFD57_07105, partial [Clostridia bacterium]|nr:hypothetical protein [Clostridia bacterium]